MVIIVVVIYSLSGLRTDILRRWEMFSSKKKAALHVPMPEEYCGVNS